MRTKLEDREAFVIAKEEGGRRKGDLCFQRGGRGRRRRIRTHLEVSRADDGVGGAVGKRWTTPLSLEGRKLKDETFITIHTVVRTARMWPGLTKIRPSMRHMYA